MVEKKTSMVEKGRSRSETPKGTKEALPKNRPRSRSREPPPVKDLPPSKSVPLPPKPKAIPPYMGMPLEEVINNLPLTKVHEYDDDDDFEKQVKRCVPSEFVLIASQDEISKAQEDYAAMEHFKIKPPEGKKRWLNQEQAGSVATCALLQLMYEHPNAWVAKEVKKENKEDKDKEKTQEESKEESQEKEEGDANQEGKEFFTTEQILHEMQDRIKTCSHQDANPTISSSRPLGPPRLDEGVYAPYYVVPPKYVKGTRRALLIGVVTGEGKDLRGPINDLKNIQRFLINHCGFLPENITMLQDTKKVPPEQRPTKKNILNGWKTIIEQSQPYDVNFIQFSGHGNRDYNNLYIMPSDYKKNGYIVDDIILNNLIKAMPRHVYTTFLVDCCYSGTVGELPYILKASSGGEQELQSNFDTTKLKSNNKKDKDSKSNSKGGKRQRRASQTIEKFYDMDTKEEAEEKEAQAEKDEANGKKNEGKLIKKARKLKRNLMHFDPMKLVKLVAESSKKAAEKLDKGIEKVVDSAKGSKSDKKAAKEADKKTKEEKEAAELQSSNTPMKKVKLKDGTYTMTPIRNNKNKRDKSPIRERSGGTTAPDEGTTPDRDRSKSPLKHRTSKTPSSPVRSK
ncbi:Metacaspase-1 [Seminavis robusta]|uniref:Metacaspase-1 n=1 Tax=Seminavis robusta TaxID=568900 RepID=A0A9N8HV35_9STRA|nr:Metacaspase-1 [Seminavis robusta]|eukprot:Sro1459_g274480.1 Metacaspase-1 (624) ;mRNA; f:544-2415